MRDAQLVSEIEALDPLRREALASVGAAERLGAEGSATAWRPARPRAKDRWHVGFRWDDGGAHDVVVTDHHRG